MNQIFKKIGKEIVISRKYLYLNIYYFVLISLIFFMLFLYSDVFSSDESPSEIELIKKIGSKYRKEIIKSSKKLDEVAAKAGLTTEELKRACIALSIDIEYLDDEKLESVSLNKIASKDYILDVIIEYDGISPYILLVEKSTHKIFVLKCIDGERKLIDVFDC